MANPTLHQAFQEFPKLSAPLTNEGNVEGPGVPDGTIAAGQTIAIPWYRLLVTLWQRTGGSSGGGSVPIGTVVDYAGASAPAGWLLCDGSAVGRGDYPGLFAALGTLWGAGDGSTTFNLPDFSGRFSRGNTPGAVGGSSSIVLTIPNLPPHNHPVIDPGHLHLLTDPGHAHALTDPGHTHTQLPHHHAEQGVNAGADGTSGLRGANVANTTSIGQTDDTTAVNQSATTGVSVNTATTGVTVQPHLTGVTTGNTGAGTPLDVTPPFAGVMKVIKY